MNIVSPLVYQLIMLLLLSYCNYKKIRTWTLPYETLSFNTSVQEISKLFGGLTIIKSLLPYKLGKIIQHSSPFYLYIHPMNFARSSYPDREINVAPSDLIYVLSLISCRSWVHMQCLVSLMNRSQLAGFTENTEKATLNSW